MSKITLECIEKSFKEQREALEKMFSLFPGATYELQCNSFNGRDYKSFEVYVKLEKFAEIAHEYYFEKADLFDYGRPKIIEQNSRTWKSDFVRIYFTWHKEYNFYDTEHPIRAFIYLKSQKKSIGLKDWKKQYPTFLKLMDKNPNEELVKIFKTKIQEINAEVLKWGSELRRLLREIKNFKL